MTPDRVKEILTAWPPDRECLDEEVRQALAMVENDSGLQQWWEHEQTFDSSVKEALTELEPSEKAVNDTVKLVLSQNVSQTKTLAFQRYTKWFSSAAALVVAAFMAIQLLSGTSHNLPDGLDAFRRSVVGVVADGKIGGLSFTSRDIDQLMQWLKNEGGAVGSQDPRNNVDLKKMKLKGLGCRILTIDEYSVSVICMECKKGHNHHLFTMARSEFDSKSFDEIREVFDDLSLKHRVWSDDENVHVLVSVY